MGFKNFIIDSIKYSIKEKTTFLVFGLLLVALTFLPDVMDVLAEPLMLLKSSPVFLISSLISLILFAVQGGYLSKVLEDLIDGNDDIPKFQFNDIILHIKEGVKDLVLGLYYCIPLFLLLLTASLENILGEDFILIIFVISMILLYLFMLIVQTAVLYTVIDSYKKAFNIIYIFKKSREIGFKRLHVVLILSILILAIVSSIVMTNTDPITTAIMVAIGFFLYPILAIMDVRYLALIGRELKNKK